MVFKLAASDYLWLIWRHHDVAGDGPMSFLVELARGAYPADALNGFSATTQFGLDNARAMMWLSQLAYETAHEDKVKGILGDWQLTMRAFVANDPATGLPPKSACVVVAAGRGATFVTFAGSDPLKFEDWITDFDAVQSADDLHSGFQNAVETIWPVIQTAIANRPAANEPLFFTGHSLGGALAILAAARAANEPKLQTTVVYTFGSPRTGGSTFFDGYPLGDTTFRLINGNDIVPTVPPAQPGDYRHVGQSIQCPTDGRFDGAPVSAAAANKPDIIDGAVQAGLADLRAFAAFRLIRGIGPRPLDRLAGLLPRMVRDHVPTNYFRALSITV
jgi:Lipase (class 3)